jgi:hypothetical protein
VWIGPSPKFGKAQENRYESSLTVNKTTGGVAIIEYIHFEKTFYGISSVGKMVNSLRSRLICRLVRQNYSPPSPLGPDEQGAGTLRWSAPPAEGFQRQLTSGQIGMSEIHTALSRPRSKLGSSIDHKSSRTCPGRLPGAWIGQPRRVRALIALRTTDLRARSHRNDVSSSSSMGEACQAGASPCVTQSVTVWVLPSGANGGRMSASSLYVSEPSMTIALSRAVCAAWCRQHHVEDSEAEGVFVTHRSARYGWSGEPDHDAWIVRLDGPVDGGPASVVISCQGGEMYDISAAEARHLGEVLLLLAEELDSG